MPKRSLQRLRRAGVLPILAMILLLALLWTAGSAGASESLKRMLAGPPPTMINYQGLVNVSGSPFTGTGHFKFAVVDSATGDGATNYWANDGIGSGEPGTAVALTVSSGLFNVLLGDTSLTGMTQTLDDTAFSETNTFLRVWFSQNSGGPFEALEPNQRIASVAYALRAKFAENSPSGPSGPTGPSGPSGPDGATGPSGPSGPDGATGPSGPSGPSGPGGATGPSGPSGPDGATGPSGPSGPDGATGPSGPSGPDGATGPSGPSGPDGATGPSGPSGPSGPDGATGPSGPSGPDGATGATGPSGPSGPDGATGPSGPSGPSGPNGASGPTGPSGPSGPDGATGPSGPSGPSGPLISFYTLTITGPGPIVSVSCDPGDQATGGGYEFPDPFFNPTISAPSSSGGIPDGWIVEVGVPGPPLTAHVICADLVP